MRVKANTLESASRVLRYEFPTIGRCSRGSAVSSTSRPRNIKSHGILAVSFRMYRRRKASYVSICCLLFISARDYFSQEYSQRRQAADHHRLLSLFETWHMSSLASAAASRAAIRGFQRQRAAVTLANNFRAWASSSRARAWRRRRCLRLGLAALIEKAALSRRRVRPLCNGLPSGYEVVSLGVACGSHVASHSNGVAAGAVGGVQSGRGVDRRVQDGQESGCALDRIVDSPPSWGGRGGDIYRGEYFAAQAAEAVASAHRRRVMLHRGLRAFFAGCETAAGERGNCEGPWSGARAVLVAWREAARARRRARAGGTLAVDAFQKWCLARAVREWRKRASANALRRRKCRRRVLRMAFVALRQVRS